MNLYEINREIEFIIDQSVDPETGELLADAQELTEQLNALQMQRTNILEHLAKLVLNTRAEEDALKAEEERLKARRERLEKKENRLMDVLDRECCGVKTDLGIATVSYRHSERVEIISPAETLAWLRENGHDDCYHTPEPEISKSEVKKLLNAGEAVPGAYLVQGVSCNLK